MKARLFTRNFTFLLLGQAFSLVGNHSLKFALSMYVLEQTGSAAVFAGMLAVAMLPSILLTPLGGVLADRADRRRIMIMLDGISGLVVLTGALLMRSFDTISVTGLLMIALSVLGAFETPTVQACIPQMHQGSNLVKANAAVSQVSALTALLTPFLGALFYSAFGIIPVLYAAAACFLATAGMESFIRLQKTVQPAGRTGLAVVRDDMSRSLRFISRERPEILKLLILAALLNFFIMGLAVVGFPYLVRNVLGLSAAYYGAAESAMGLAAVAGGIWAGAMSGKGRLGKCHVLLLVLGLCLLPAGLVFMLPLSAVAKYLVLVLCFCACQLLCIAMSVLLVSAIQERTPQQLTGKVMSCVSAISMCAQPLGQMAYGGLFDLFSTGVYWVLLPSSGIICLVALLSAGIFSQLETSACA